MNDKKVLLFGIAKERKKQMIALCRKLDISPVIVARGQFGETLGALAGIDGFSLTGKPYTGDNFSEEMLVFSGLSSDALDIFLEAYKETGMEPVPLKAVLTPHNIFWNARQLYAELEKEMLHYKNLRQ